MTILLAILWLSSILGAGWTCYAIGAFAERMKRRRDVQLSAAAWERECWHWKRIAERGFESNKKLLEVCRRYRTQDLTGRWN